MKPPCVEGILELLLSRTIPDHSKTATLLPVIREDWADISRIDSRIVCSGSSNWDFGIYLKIQRLTVFPTGKLRQRMYYFS
jgi:hypothetical protein